MRPKAIGHPFGFGEGSLGHRTALGAALVQSAGDVDVHVGDRLIRRTSVVLPDGDAWPTERDIYCPCSFTSRDHQLGSLRVGQVEDRLAVAGRDHKQVRFSADLLGHENRDRRRLGDDGVVALAGQIGAERTPTRIQRRDVDAALRRHDISSESRNACSSSRFSFS
jgi:hypothetical protein